MKAPSLAFKHLGLKASVGRAGTASSRPAVTFKGKQTKQIQKFHPPKLKKPY